MRASRLLSMLILLQLRGRTNAARLAEALEVSVRTIYRDVDALSAAGVPVYAEPGRDGGIALDQSYRTRLTGLTIAEAETLALAGPGGQARDLGLGGEALAAQLKLRASLPADRNAGAERVASRYHVDPVPWYQRAETLPCLPMLAEAVWRDRPVRFDYEGWRGRGSRRVEPLGLVQKGGLWYLIGSAEGAILTFRVANIHGLELLDGGFERPRDFDLARHWASRIATFEAELAGGQAVIRISEEGRRILRAVNAMADEAVAATARPWRDGWFEASIPIEATDYAARQLLRLGTEVEVISPDALREAVASEAARVCALYAPSGRTARRRRDRSG
jgi:predicted DNA-binding transcriptional regulator YafY